MRWALPSAIILLFLGCCGKPVSPQEGPLKDTRAKSLPEYPSPPRDVTRVEIRNVGLRLSSTTEVRVPLLRGELWPSNQGIPDLSDPDSYLIDVHDAEIRIAGGDLGALMESTLAESEVVPIRDLRIEVENGELVIRGVVQQPIPVQATITASVGVTPEGWVELRPTAIDAAGLPVGNLLELFGLELADLFSGMKSRGFWLDGNRIVMEPQKIVQRPQLRGRIFDVQTVPGDLVLFMDALSASREFQKLDPPVSVPNYFFLFGGDIRFGNFVIEGADLMLTDKDPSDLLDLNLPDYRIQLIAGSVDFLGDMGMVVKVPDFADVVRQQ